MSKDLEEQLDEMGSEYRAVVARLRAAREAPQGIRSPVFRLRSKVLRSVLAAASLLVFAGLAVLFFGRQDLRHETSDARHGAQEYKASIAEMIATQRPDGGWANDFLTRRNAEALRTSSSAVARIAYKKAVRNLRVRGLL